MTFIPGSSPLVNSSPRNNGTSWILFPSSMKCWQVPSCTGLMHVTIASVCLWLCYPCHFQNPSLHSTPPQSQALTFFFSLHSWCSLGLREGDIHASTSVSAQQLFIKSMCRLINSAQQASLTKAKSSTICNYKHQYWEGILSTCLFSKTTVSRFSPKSWNPSNHVFLTHRWYNTRHEFPPVE